MLRPDPAATGFGATRSVLARSALEVTPAPYPRHPV